MVRPLTKTEQALRVRNAALPYLRAYGQHTTVGPTRITVAEAGPFRMALQTPFSGPDNKPQPSSYDEALALQRAPRVLGYVLDVWCGGCKKLSIEWDAAGHVRVISYEGYAQFEADFWRAVKVKKRVPTS